MDINSFIDIIGSAVCLLIIVFLWGASQTRRREPRKCGITICYDFHGNITAVFVPRSEHVDYNDLLPFNAPVITCDYPPTLRRPS